MRSCYHGYFALCFLYMMIVVSWYGVYMITVGTKFFRGEILCASEIRLYHPVVARVKDYTRENTRQSLYNVKMDM